MTKPCLATQQEAGATRQRRVDQSADCCVAWRTCMSAHTVHLLSMATPGTPAPVVLAHGQEHKAHVGMA